MHELLLVGDEELFRDENIESEFGCASHDVWLELGLRVYF